MKKLLKILYKLKIGFEMLYKIRDWRPDYKSFNQGYCQIAKNVIYQKDGYSSFPKYEPSSTPTDKKIKELYIIQDRTLAICEDNQLLRYKEDKWYELGYLNLEEEETLTSITHNDEFLFFAVNSNRIIALDRNQLELHDITFDKNLKIDYCKYSDEFLFVSGKHLETNTTFIAWSEASNPFEFLGETAVLSDIHYFPDESGTVQYISNNHEIFLDKCIYKMKLSNHPYSWIISLVTDTVGLVSKKAICEYQKNAFFLSKQGFYHLNGSHIEPIGHEKVDKFFARRIANYHEAIQQCAYDEKLGIVVWKYKAQQQNSGHPREEILVYNYLSQGWSLVENPQISKIYTQNNQFLCFSHENCFLTEGKHHLHAEILTDRFYPKTEYLTLIKQVNCIAHCETFYPDIKHIAYLQTYDKLGQKRHFYRENNAYFSTRQTGQAHQLHFSTAEEFENFQAVDMLFKTNGKK